MGLIHQLHPQHGTEPLEKACAQARLHGQYRLAELRNWLEAPSEQQTFSFLTEHEIIRDLSDYGGLVGFEHHN